MQDKLPNNKGIEYKLINYWTLLEDQIIVSTRGQHKQNKCQKL